MLFKVVHVCISLMYTLKRTRCVVGLFLHTYIHTYTKIPFLCALESNDEMKNMSKENSPSFLIEEKDEGKTRPPRALSPPAWPSGAPSNRGGGGGGLLLLLRVRPVLVGHHQRKAQNARYFSIIIIIINNIVFVLPGGRGVGIRSRSPRRLGLRRHEMRLGRAQRTRDSFIFV